ncbi:MAG: CHASE2 domain-containing protein, partial [Cyanobacteria bacterium J06639_1]
MLKRFWGKQPLPASRSPSRRRRQIVSIGGWTAFFALLWVLDTPWVRSLIVRDLPEILPESASVPLVSFQTFQSRLNPLPQWELGVQTLMTFLRGTSPPLDDVVLLAIDDPSLDIINLVFPEELEETPILKEMQSWPWSRRVHAEAARAMLDAGAEVVVFDIVFDKPSPFGEDDDRAFEELLEDYGDRVVLGARYYLASAVAGSRDQLLLPHYANANLDVQVGFVNVERAIDTAVYKLAANYDLPSNLPKIPSLSEAALQASGRQRPRIFDNEWLFYNGPAATYATFSYQDLMVPALKQVNLRGGEVFRDRIVIVGATASILQDFQDTPW